MSTECSREITSKQSIPKELRYTFEDFNREFPNDDTCLEYIKEQRFPGGLAPCAKCGQETKHHRIAGRTAYSCQNCGTHIYPLAGTIFEKSTTSLRVWFYSMYLMGSTRCGISAKQIQRETSVTYKTAWRIFKQIRSLLSEGDLQLEGTTVEVDETYIGGVRKYGTGRPIQGDKRKPPCLASSNAKRVVAKAIESVNAQTLVGNIHKHVLPSSIVYTDELPAYNTAPGNGSTTIAAFTMRLACTRHGRTPHTNSVKGF